MSLLTYSVAYVEGAAVLLLKVPNKLFLFIVKVRHTYDSLTHLRLL